MPVLKASPDQPLLQRGPEDSSRLVSGRNSYLADNIGKRHLHARLVRSFVAHGRIRSIDIDHARSMPGVVAVLTAADFGDKGAPTIPLRSADARVEAYQQPVLASDIVRYVGEPVAVVIATDAYAAEDAAEAIALDIAPLQAVASVDAASFLPDERSPSGTMFEVTDQSGDWDAVLAAADHVVSGSFELQRQTGLPLETRGIIAEWDDAGDLHIWGLTKYVHFSRRTMAAAFDLPVERVHGHAVDVGGMFGVRGEFYPEDLLIPWAARIVGRPVAWREDRREHLLSTNHSRQQRHDFELAIQADGTFVAYRDRVSADLGAYIRPAGIRPLLMLAESVPGPYRWMSTHTELIAYATNKTPVGNMRGPAASEATFVRERAIDRAAALLGMDPLALRRHNLITVEELPKVIELGHEIHGPTYDLEDYGRILDRALEAFDVDRARAEINERRSRGERVGIGYGLFMEHTGNGISETVGVELTIDGRLALKTGECEIGQGLTSMMHVLAQQELGIEPDRVDVLSGDSRAYAEGLGTFGSRTAIFVGNALVDAFSQLSAAARAGAAKLLGVPESEVIATPDGFRSAAEPIDWKELAPMEVTGRFEMAEPTWGFGLHIAQVSIDPVTAQPRLERLLCAYDGGRMLDPVASYDQLHGGTVYGVGGAMFEEIRYEQDGQPSVTTLADYKLPLFSELPEIEVLALAEQPAVGNPLGLRGFGEAGVLGVGAAIANAAVDALPEADQVLSALPVTAERLIGVLRATDGRR